MPRTAQDFSDEPFECPVLPGPVTIVREFTVRLSTSGEELSRFVAQTDCTSKDLCGIATHSTMSTSYDWSRCAYRQAQRR